MKPIINLLTIIGTLVFLFTSCDLDKYPPDQFDTKDAFRTLTDARNHRNGLYDRLRSCKFGTFTQTSELMCDMFNATGNYGNRQGAIHRVEIGMLTDGNVSSIWSGSYGGINQANHFLDNVDNVQISTPADATKIEYYKAEVRYVRAYLYYVLITHFGVDYEPSTATEFPGVPLVTKFDIEQKPVRAALADVYYFILDELEAIESLFTEGGKQNSIEITRDAVLALKSKIQLLMHDYAGAATTANALINSNRYPLVTTLEDTRRMWVNDESTEDIFTLYADINEAGPTMAMFINFDPGMSDANEQELYLPDYIPTKKAIEQYPTGDFRRDVFFSKQGQLIVVAENSYSNLRFLNKFPGNPALYTKFTNYQHKPKVARIAEQYLIAAEAMAHPDNPAQSIPGALNRLKTLQEARGVNALSVITTYSDQALRDEWARETLGEGVRLECLKRWNIGYENRTPQTNAGSAVVTGVDFTERMMGPNQSDYYRFTLPIPQNDLQTNPYIKQTPEWVNPQ